MKLRPTRRSVRAFLKLRSREWLRLPNKNKRPVLRYLSAIDAAFDSVENDDVARGFVRGYETARAELALLHPEIDAELQRRRSQRPRNHPEVEQQHREWVKRAKKLTKDGKTAERNLCGKTALHFDVKPQTVRPVLQDAGIIPARKKKKI